MGGLRSGQEKDWPKVIQKGQQQIPFGSLFSQVLAQGLSRGEGDDVSFWVKRPLYYDSSLAALLRFREN